MANSDVLARLWRDAPEVAGEQWLAWWVENAWSPDITWRAIEGAPDDVGAIEGPEGLLRYYLEWAELFDEIRPQASRFVDVGDQVVACVHVSARSRSTGMPLNLDYAVVHRLDDSGRIVAGREYATLEEAMRVAEAGSGQKQGGFRRKTAVYNRMR